MGSAKIPAGTTAQRDGSPASGFLRYNTTTNTFEGYHAAAWDAIGGGLDSALVLDIAAPNQTITAGVGLGGGGNGSTVTLNIDSAELLAYYESSLRHDNLSGFVANEHIDHSGVTITAGTGLTGGGTIAATRTLAVDSAQLIAYYNSSLVHDNLSGFVANEHIDHSGVTLTAGAGLTGGGTIASNRSFAVGAGTGVTVNANDVAIGQPVGTTDSVTFNGLYASGNVIVGGNLTVNGTQTTVNSTTVQIDDKLFTLGDAAADSSGMNGGGIELSTTGGANPSILYFTTGDKFQTNKNWDVQGNVTLSGTVDGVDVAGLEGRSIVAGSGLTGGGTLASSRTLNVGAGTGIAVAADAVAIDSAGLLAYYNSSLVHDNLSGFVANEHIDHSGVSITAGVGLKGGGTIASTRDLAIDSAELLAYYNSSLVHDNLSGFVANEHIDHSGVTMTAGNGLTGGGTIASTRSFAVGAGTGIAVSADAVAIDSAGLLAYYESSLRHDNLSGFVANEHIDHSSVSMVAGTGLTGGGTIASNRTFAIDSNQFTVYYEPHIDHDNLTNFVANEHIDHSGVSITAGVGLKGGGTIASTRDLAIDSAELLAYYNGSIVHDNLSGFVANEHIDHSGVTITAGNGLTGGGTIASTRTFAVGAGTGITVNTNDIATNDGEIVHDNLSGFVANEHIDHSGVSITAGIGLAGGGTIASTRDLAIDSAELLAYFGGTKGFDADKLDGQHGSHYRINVYNAAGSLLN